MRTLIAALFALATVGSLSVVPAHAKPDRVGVCHYDADASLYVYITISEHGLKGHKHHAKDVFDISKDNCLALNVKV